MPNITISFQPPISEFIRRFGSIDITSFLRDRIKEIAFLVEAESKKVTPVRTGRLRASIRVMPAIQPLQAIIQPNTDYAIYVHEGTRYMAARPFMWWGAQTASEGFEDRITNELDKFIKSKVEG